MHCPHTVDVRVRRADYEGSRLDRIIGKVPGHDYGVHVHLVRCSRHRYALLHRLWDPRQKRSSAAVAGCTGAGRTPATAAEGCRS